MDFNEIPSVELISGSTYLDELDSDQQAELMTKAYEMWRHHTGYFGLEWPLEKFNQDQLMKAQKAVALTGGWVKYARTLRRLSMNQAASRLKIDKSTLLDIEKSERNGTIKVKTLSRIATQLGMELVIGFRPVEWPSRAIWNSLEPATLRRFRSHATKRNGAVRKLVGEALALSDWTKERKRQGWTGRPLQLKLDPED